MKCINCGNVAAWIYRPTENQSMAYCNGCLPGFLTAQKKAGHLEKADGADAVVNEAIEILNTPVVEEKAVYTIEEPVVEEPKTVKKTNKKAEVNEPDSE
jgi:hypothetical protein